MIDYLFEIVEPNGYCLNGYPKKELLEQFKKLEDVKTNPIMKDFFEKAKKFWKN